jgi:hypothetical protein
MKRILILVLATLAAGCTEEATAPAAQGGEASGEVLGGTISDAMIPLDQLASEAPLAPRQGPSAAQVDSEQPDVTPEAGVESTTTSTTTSTGAGAAPAAPAPASPPVE